MNLKEKQLPTKFTLGAIEWNISIEDVDLSNKDVLGESCGITNKIKIAKHYKGEKMNPQNKELTLYHEVVHAILDTLGEFELSKNEEFVQKFSLLLHQFEKTKK